MGPNGDEAAVVDQYCRVRGVEGLRVVDTSVMPHVTSRGPAATAVMIGERVAAFFQDAGRGQCIPVVGARRRGLPLVGGAGHC
ncbi:hypothetical protein GCM10023175_24690 [Pseudonocardia xishanensis]|uniref:Glucose-methanol-choline oxidoreductase C-terminal domain-containing protein n=2 Tax=Pseudonocardia xishanensis TaxID=630995 RepID=A0ABP8RS77_9PSEU